MNEKDLRRDDLPGGHRADRGERDPAVSGQERLAHSETAVSMNQTAGGPVDPSPPATTQQNKRRAPKWWWDNNVPKNIITGVVVALIVAAVSWGGTHVVRWISSSSGKPSVAGPHSAGSTSLSHSVPSRSNQHATTQRRPLASGGAALSVAASFTAPGAGAGGLAFDGRDLWTSDNSGTIFQIDVNGQPDASYQSPEVTPEGITWDGHSFWVFTTNQSLIYHFQIRNGQVQTLGSINPHVQVIGSDNLAWVHGDIWLADQYNVKLLTANGAVVRQIPKSNEVMGLAWDGSHLWLGYDNFPNGSRIEEDTASGTPIHAFTVPITGLTALAWADGTVWAVGRHDVGSPILIYRLRMASA